MWSSGGQQPQLSHGPAQWEEPSNRSCRCLLGKGWHSAFSFCPPGLPHNPCCSEEHSDHLSSRRCCAQGTSHRRGLTPCVTEQGPPRKLLHLLPTPAQDQSVTVSSESPTWHLPLSPCLLPLGPDWYFLTQSSGFPSPLAPGHTQPPNSEGVGRELREAGRRVLSLWRYWENPTGLQSSR